MNNRTLLDLSSDTLNQVTKSENLDIQSLINLRRVNKRAYGLFQPTFSQHLKKYVERSAKKQVETLLSMHLNFDAGHLCDAFHTALRLGDIDLCKVIARGREDILEQIEIPKKLVDESNSYDFSAVVAAISSGQNREEAFAKFRTDLDNIVKDKGFPFQALLNAYETYDENTRYLHYPWTIEQYKLFIVKVLGYLQRLSPAWLRKELATGIKQIKEQGKVCGDTFTLKTGESTDPNVPNSGLGFDFGVTLLGGAVSWHGERLLGGFTSRSYHYMKDYLELKQQRLVNLCSKIQNQKRLDV